MSAIGNNKKALKYINTRSNNAESRFESSRICILVKNEDQNKILMRALGEFLGRIWHKIDMCGEISDEFATHAINSAESCKVDLKINTKYGEPYDYVIGVDTNIGNKTGISISTDGWNVHVGNYNIDPKTKNPLSQYCAAALVSADVFKTIFRDMHDFKRMPSPYVWNCWYDESCTPPNNFDLCFDNMYIFGIGAVSHSLLWILNQWPHKITGSIHLIDYDQYDDSNAHRYLGMLKEDIGKQKVTQMKNKLLQQHPKLQIYSYVEKMSEFINAKKFKIKSCICGLDKKELRRELALKLPHTTINMWTDGLDLGATTHSFNNKHSCLFCSYDNTMIVNNTNQVLQNDEDECSTFNMVDTINNDSTKIPLVFSSGMAGFGGFIETMKHVSNIKFDPMTWQMSHETYPTKYAYRSYERKHDCYLCDKNTRKIVKKKYE